MTTYETLKNKLKHAQKTMQFDENEFNRLLVLGMSIAETPKEPRSPVFLRYKMSGKNWGHHLHPVPFDIKDFSIGIEKYSKGMVLITDPGIYQVSAMLSNDVRLRIKKNSDLYAHTFGGHATCLMQLEIFDTVSIEKREGHMNAVFGHDCNYFEVHKIH